MLSLNLEPIPHFLNIETKG